MGTRFFTSINRRHLTPSQKAAVAVEMLPMLEAEAKERQKIHGNTAPGRQSETLVPELGQVKDSSRQPTAVRIAAAAIGVSHGNISEKSDLKSGTGACRRDKAGQKYRYLYSNL